jgi:pimeloyl-ACP methyl ester carboxylesterase
MESSFPAMFAIALFAAMLGGLVVITGALTDWAERDYPRQGLLHDVGGVKLHVVERGAGRPVLFIHGAFSALQEFTDTVFGEVAKRYRAVAVDRPGHGYSQCPPESALTLADQARLIRDCARRFGLERPIIVGFSYGGAVALAYALEFPDETGGLVLINPVSHEWSGPVALGYSIAAWPVLGKVFVNTLVAPLASLTIPSNARRAFAPAKVPDTFWGAPLSLGLRPDSFLVNARNMRGLKADVRQQASRYGRIKAPLVILASQGNRIVDVDTQARALAAAVPGAELVMLENTGHPVMYSRPQAVIAAIDTVAAKAG